MKTMLSLSECRSWEFNFLKWLNIGYICYIRCPVLMYIMLPTRGIRRQKQSMKTHHSEMKRKVSQLNLKSAGDLSFLARLHKISHLPSWQSRFSLLRLHPIVNSHCSPSLYSAIVRIFFYIFPFSGLRICN